MRESPKRVGCYIRVSTENQLENYSIDEQTERLMAYCTAKDWNIYKLYIDGGYSGGNLNRPALEQMLSDIRKSTLDMVVVYKLDRLSRSQKDTLMLIEDEFIANKVDFVSMNENFDTSTPFGKAMIGILSVFAQLEKDQITERFTMGRIGRSKAGYYHGGSTSPTGYKYINGKLEIDNTKAPLVQEVFNLFISGKSVNSIVNHMQKQYGAWGSHPHTLYILRNSVYIGKVKFKGVEYDGLHAPIIDRPIFERAQELLNSPDRETEKNTAQKTPFRAGFLLSSLIFCENCGARYSASHGYYKCYSRSKDSVRFVKDPNCHNDNWRIPELDALVSKEIETLVYNNALVDDIFDSKAEEAYVVNFDDIRNQIKSVEAQLSRVLDLYQLGDIPMSEISDRVKDLQQKKSILEAQIVEQPKARKQDFIDRLSTYGSIFANGDTDVRRLFISSLIDSIWIDGERVNIKWRI